MSAWTRIAHTEVGSGGAADIVFSSIAETYTDLALNLSLRTTTNTTLSGLRIEFNDNTQSIYSVRNLQAIYSSGPNATVNPYNVTNAMVVSFIPGASQTASIFNSVQLYIPNYSGSANKLVSIEGVSENNSGFSTSEIVSLNFAAGLFSSTSAITKIKISVQEANNLVEYSSATLYGITRGSSGGVVVS